VHYLRSSAAVAAFVESLDPDTLASTRSRLVVVRPFRDRDLQAIEEAAARDGAFRGFVVAARDQTALGAVVFQAADDEAYARLRDLHDADLVGDEAVSVSLPPQDILAALAPRARLAS
jgi:hypothetical protein